MVRSNWRAAVLVLLAAAALALSRSAAQESAGTTEEYMTVHENGQAVRCKILETRRLANGSRTLKIQPLSGGAVMTLTDNGDISGSQEAPGKAHMLPILQRNKTPELPTEGMPAGPPVPSTIEGRGGKETIIWWEEGRGSPAHPQGIVPVDHGHHAKLPWEGAPPVATVAPPVTNMTSSPTPTSAAPVVEGPALSSFPSAAPQSSPLLQRGGPRFVNRSPAVVTTRDAAPTMPVIVPTDAKSADAASAAPRRPLYVPGRRFSADTGTIVPSPGAQVAKMPVAGAETIVVVSDPEAPAGRVMSDKVAGGFGSHVGPMFPIFGSFAGRPHGLFARTAPGTGTPFPERSPRTTVADAKGTVPTNPSMVYVDTPKVSGPFQQPSSTSPGTVAQQPAPQRTGPGKATEKNPSPVQRLGGKDPSSRQVVSNDGPALLPPPAKTPAKSTPGSPGSMQMVPGTPGLTPRTIYAQGPTANNAAAGRPSTTGNPAQDAKQEPGFFGRLFGRSAPTQTAQTKPTTTSPEKKNSAALAQSKTVPSSGPAKSATGVPAKAPSQLAQGATSPQNKIANPLALPPSATKTASVAQKTAPAASTPAQPANVARTPAASSATKPAGPQVAQQSGVNASATTATGGTKPADFTWPTPPPTTAQAKAIQPVAQAETSSARIPADTTKNSPVATQTAAAGQTVKAKEGLVPFLLNRPGASSNTQTPQGPTNPVPRSIQQAQDLKTASVAGTPGYLPDSKNAPGLGGLQIPNSAPAPGPTAQAPGSSKAGLNKPNRFDIRSPEPKPGDSWTLGARLFHKSSGTGSRPGDPAPLDEKSAVETAKATPFPKAPPGTIPSPAGSQPATTTVAQASLNVPPAAAPGAPSAAAPAAGAPPANLPPAGQPAPAKSAAQAAPKSTSDQLPFTTASPPDPQGGLPAVSREAPPRTIVEAKPLPAPPPNSGTLETPKDTVPPVAQVPPRDWRQMWGKTQAPPSGLEQTSAKQTDATGSGVAQASFNTSAKSKDPLLHPEKFDPAAKPLPKSAAGFGPQNKSDIQQVAHSTRQGPAATAQGSSLPPPGSHSVLAAGNGVMTPFTYVPVPVVTIPDPVRPPTPPVPHIPEAPQPAQYINAFTPPAQPGTPGQQPNAGMNGPTMNPRMPLNPALIAQAYAQNPFLSNPALLQQGIQQFAQFPPAQQAQIQQAVFIQQQNYLMQQQALFLQQQQAMMQRASSLNYPANYQGPQPPNPVGPTNQPDLSIAQARYMAPPALTPYVQQPGATQEMPVNQNMSVQQVVTVLIESPYPAQREWAASSLATFNWRNNPQILHVLLQAARQDPAASVRAGCIYSLSRMNAATEPVMTTLQSLQNDPDPRVRHEVQQAFLRMGAGN